MDLHQFSARLHEARKDVEAGEAISVSRPAAAILSVAQGLGETLQALAAYHGLRLDPKQGHRSWGETLWERGMLPGWEAVRSDVGTLGVLVRHIHVPFEEGRVEAIRADHAVFALDVAHQVDALAVGAVEGRAGPLKAALEMAADRIRQADMELKSGLKSWDDRRAGAVMAFRESAAASVRALWLKAGMDDRIRQAGGQLRLGQPLDERWTALEEGGHVPPLRPSMRAMLRDLDKLDNRAKTTFLPRTAPEAEPISEDEAGFAETVATRARNLARDFLAEDLRPLTLPQPVPPGDDLSPG